LKGGEQQVARFALRVPPEARERSYRIVLQEVPRQRVEMGFSTVLRMLVPVFVPTPNPSAAMEWAVALAADGLAVTARNKGNVHVQIKSLKISGDQGAPLEKQANIYVLPGAVRRIKLATARPLAPGMAILLTAESDQGPLSANLRVGAAEGAPVPQ
ncbi:MAG TPA: hypothetical protein VNT42_09400, partial [Sphingomonas sp.]|nr:hypothetical protein [Sphingomonas sp.]